MDGENCGKQSSVMLKNFYEPTMLQVDGSTSNKLAKTMLDFISTNFTRKNESLNRMTVSNYSCNFAQPR